VQWGGRGLGRLAGLELPQSAHGMNQDGKLNLKKNFTAKELNEAYHGLQDNNTSEDDGTGNCGAGEALQSQRGQLGFKII